MNNLRKSGRKCFSMWYATNAKSAQVFELGMYWFTMKIFLGRCSEWPPQLIIKSYVQHIIGVYPKVLLSSVICMGSWLHGHSGHVSHSWTMLSPSRSNHVLISILDNSCLLISTEYLATLSITLLTLSTTTWIIDSNTLLSLHLSSILSFCAFFP
jgi:hypothetical protein